MTSISVVLPAYNEEPVIAATVSSVVGTLEQLCPDYEVIVVDDGSRDRTAAVVAAVSAANPRVRCVSHPHNRGYGAALATGFDAAVKELVFLTDGDKQFDVRELRDFLPLMGDADLVIGFRDPRADPWPRLAYAWGWKHLVNGWQISTLTQLRDGFAAPVLTFSNESGTNSLHDRPDCVGPIVTQLSDFNAPYVVSGLASPAPGTFGNCRRNPIVAPGLTTADISLGKNFPLREGARLEFRADFFNAFNHPNFGAISSDLNAVNFGEATNMLNRQLGGINQL